MTRRAEPTRRPRLLPAACLAALCAGGLFAQEDAATSSGREPRVLWKYAPEGGQFSGVLADKGTVFALDRAGTIHALEAPTGEVVWTSDGKLPFSFGYGMALSPDPGFPALLVGCDSGVVALDPKTGDVLWQTALPLGAAGPACTREVVVVGSADGKVYGLELRTGAIRWQHGYLEDRPDDPPGVSGNDARFQGRPARPGNAATDGELCVVPVFDQCRALCLDAASGARRWAFATQGWVYARPAIGPRYVYVASQDRHLYAVDRDSGKLAWQVETRARNEGAAAVTDRFVYFGSCDANLYAVDLGVGKVGWQYATEHEEGRGAPIYSRPLVRGDTVYLAAMSGKVYAVDRATGALRWQLEPLARSEPNSDLVEATGLLFLTTRKSGKEGESAVLAITVR